MNLNLVEFDTIHEWNMPKKKRCGPFVNGSMVVTNVPYILEYVGEKDVREYVTHDVLLELSSIFEYMTNERLVELNYLDYKSNVKMRRASSDPSMRIKQQLDTNEEKQVARYAMSEWIEKYHRIKLIIQADYSGSPMSDKSRRANSWMDLFCAKLSQLPELHACLIEKKFLTLKTDGKYILDDFVYGELNISRSTYFTRKKEALYWLGLALYEHDSLTKDI